MCHCLIPHTFVVSFEAITVARIANSSLNSEIIRKRNVFQKFQNLNEGLFENEVSFQESWLLVSSTFEKNESYCHDPGVVGGGGVVVRLRFFV